MTFLPYYSTETAIFCGHDRFCPMRFSAPFRSSGFVYQLIHYRIHSSNAIGFTEKKQLRGIDFRIRHKEPRMVTLLKKIRKHHPVHDYYLCVIMHYMRLPIINAVFKRFFGK